MEVLGQPPDFQAGHGPQRVAEAPEPRLHVLCRSWIHNLKEHILQDVQQRSL
jgi:hypothetical protein